MSYLSETDVRGRAARAALDLHMSVRGALGARPPADSDAFDVFLSHSSSEPEEILLGVKAILEESGLKVYVDKYGDPQLSPDNVTPETAEVLRRRMRQSASLLYVYSQYSKASRWMPWELGFFDGFKGAVGIIPVTRNQEETFKGEEYLNLYPYVDIAKLRDTQESRLWINKVPGTFTLLDRWVRGTAHL